MLQEGSSSSPSSFFSSGLGSDSVVVVGFDEESDVEGASPPLVPSPSPSFVPDAAAADATEEAEKLLPWQLLLLLLQQQRGCWKKKAEVEGAEPAAVDDEEEEECLRSPPLDASDACSNAEHAAAAIFEAITDRRVLLERATAVAASILNSEDNWKFGDREKKVLLSPFFVGKKTTARYLSSALIRTED